MEWWASPRALERPRPAPGPGVSITAMTPAHRRRGVPMNRLTRAALACVFAAGLVQHVAAGEEEARAVVDKAIKAMGGEEKLSKVRAVSTKGRGTITIEGNDIDFTYETTARGIAQYRSTFEGESDGKTFRGATVLDGDKGWRKFNDDTQVLEGEMLANEKRNAYL